ncbi:S8 family serine peptidase [Marinobacter nauticus]|uniref:S8 family serine peptidase n=2 Tax=Marinobacter nauticus TaxID=2743 RepID=UPI002E2CA046|nr:S8 family serine peptidase [Marinobacter nauticus]
MRLSILAFVLVPGMALLTGCGGGSGGSDAVEPITPPSPLSGVISIEANSRVDQDTMDQLGLDGARPATVSLGLPDNFVLAGYLAGSGGSYPTLTDQGVIFSYESDAEDLYNVPMAKGQAIVLEAFGSRAGNPALRIELTDNGRIVDSAETGSAGSRVVVELGDEAEGQYSLTVRTLGSGPARYVISKNSVGTATRLNFDWPDYDFVPGEALVSMAEGKTSSFAVNAGVSGRHLGGADWLVSMPVVATSSAANSGIAGQQITLEWIRELRKRPEYKSVVPNYFFRTQATPIDEPDYSLNWHYDLVNAPIAWQIGNAGLTPVHVAVLDSGLLQDSEGHWHPDLQQNVAPEGRDFIDGGEPVDPGSSVGGDVYHGTHVAGTIGAALNNEGIGGIAFESKIVPVRVLGEGGVGTSDQLIAGIRWVTGETSGGSPKAQVVNMSLGGLPQIEALESALRYGVGEGLLFVAAAGNSATSVPSYPAASSHVLSVSAVDAGGRPASYSNFGSWIDLAAPGGDASRDGNLDGLADVVWSTSGERRGGVSVPGYRGLQGTSMASPHVAGVLALMKSEMPELNTVTVRGWLESGLLTQPQDGRTDRLGWGVIDAGKAVAKAIDGEPVTVLSASPAVVSLSNEGISTQLVEIQKFGDASVSAEMVASQPEWLGAELSGGAESGDLELMLTLKPDLLDPDEPARGVVDIAYEVDLSPNTLSIPVIGQLLSDERARDAGRHFVLLVSKEPTDGGFYLAQSQVVADVENGQYRFRFEPDDGEEPRRLSEVTPGEYFLVAGTDLDGDGLICQAGEACAEYPVSGLREVITIEDGQSLSDIRMTTSFSRPTISTSSPDILPRPGFKGYRLLEPDQAPSTNDGAKAVQ